MVEKLIVDFFEEIEKIEGITSRHGKATFLVKELLLKKYGKLHYISIQKASRLYRKFVEKESGVSASLKDPFLKDVMAKYVGFENYNAYRENNPTLTSKPELEPTIDIEKEGQMTIPPPNSSSPPSKIKLYGIVTIFSFSVFGLLYTKYQNKTCIVWKKDHYERTYCFAKDAIDNSKYLINLSSFKKVVLDSSTTFFTKGNPNYWYEKNGESKREFFTMRGIHPETKKELKPITRTVLDLEGLLNE